MNLAKLDTRKNRLIISKRNINHGAWCIIMRLTNELLKYGFKNRDQWVFDELGFYDITGIIAVLDLNGFFVIVYRNSHQVSLIGSETNKKVYLSHIRQSEDTTEFILDMCKDEPLIIQHKRNEKIKELGL